MSFINDRPLQKVYLKNTTRMSLHERFTYLRSQPDVSAIQRQQQRELQQQSARNRRLAIQMERRPAVMAALKIKKKSLRQRLGMTGPAGGQTSYLSVKDRLSLGQRGKFVNVRLNQASLQVGQQRRGRPRGRGMGQRTGSRGSSLNRLGRSQSMQSLNGRQNSGQNFVRPRSRSRSRTRTQNVGNLNPRFRRGNSLGPSTSGVGGRPLGTRRGQGLRRGGGGGVRGTRFNRGGQFRGNRGSTGGFRGRNRGNWGNNRSGGRGRGMARGRGRGRGGRNNPVPTKEELDNQLDQYMANSRYGLDRDLDNYMKQATATEEESWD